MAHAIATTPSPTCAQPPPSRRTPTCMHTLVGRCEPCTTSSGADQVLRSMKYISFQVYSCQELCLGWARGSTANRALRLADPVIEHRAQPTDRPVRRAVG